MATDLGIIKGVIELQDNFTSQLGLAEAALSRFSKENQKNLLAVAGAASLVTAAFVATATAVVALGTRGSDVNDLTETLEHFTGSASAASDVMAKMREGTKNTVDNFSLASDAAHLLSAGVKLTANDFGTLGQAAFVMQNRGLGGTKEQLDLVSDAMVSGRTRALALALGVVDVKDAQESYAKSLGITKGELSQEGIAEANRIAVMGLLSRAVKDAGVQERDFGEQIEVGKAALANWLDSMGSAIAKSPVFTAGMKEIGVVLGETFGSDSTETVKTVLHWIEQGAIVTADFGLAAVEAARVVNFAWSVIKTGVLSVETAIVGVVDGASQAMVALAEGLHKIGAVSDVTVAQTRGFRDSIHEVTTGLALETVEAAKGVTGHSEFDKTLDSLGGTMFRVRDAMVAASEAEDANGKSTDIATANQKKLEQSTKDLAASHKMATDAMVDREKVQANLDKSTGELVKIQGDLNKMIVANSGTTRDAQIADIKATFNANVAALNELDPLYKEKYKAYQDIAHESLKAISDDWASVSANSIQGLQDQANVAMETYNHMVSSGGFFRDELDKQLQKVHDTADAARGMGTAFVTAEKAAADATKAANDALDAQKAKAKAAHDEMMAMGNSQTYDLSTAAGMAEFMKANPAAKLTGPAMDPNFFKTHSLQQAQQMGLLDLYAGYRAKGGPVDPNKPYVVGEEGPETFVPATSGMIVPHTAAQSGGGIGGDMNVVIHVNGTAAETAQKISRELMRNQRLRRQFGAA